MKISPFGYWKETAKKTALKLKKRGSYKKTWKDTVAPNVRKDLVNPN